jgi:FkbM family methyltransferase
MTAIVNRCIAAFNRLPGWKRRVRVGSYQIQVPNFDRWLYAKLHAIRAMGREERRFLSSYVTRGMTVLDIGANIGLYSLFLAELVGDQGQVLAFEPDPSLFEAALTNIRENGRENIINIQNLALGSQSGQASLYRSSFNSGDNRLSASRGHKDAVPVCVARLDDIVCDAKIDFIKLDVQGWEAEVMRGMQRTLRRNPELAIYFEYWPKGLRNAGEPPLAAMEVLGQSGFSVFHPDCLQPLSAQDVQDLERTYSGNNSPNLLAKRVKSRAAAFPG